MSCFWKTKMFSDLAKEWDEILAKNDFEDIEKTDKNGERYLRQNASNFHRFVYKNGVYSKMAGFMKEVSRAGFNRIYETKHQRFIGCTGKEYCESLNTYIESKIRYFSMILECLENDHQIPAKDRFIMTRYAEGFKQKEIIAELEERGQGCNRITITRTISRYLHRWNIPILKPRKTR